MRDCMPGFLALISATELCAAEGRTNKRNEKETRNNFIAQRSIMSIRAFQPVSTKYTFYCFKAIKKFPSRSDSPVAKAPGPSRSVGMTEVEGDLDRRHKMPAPPRVRMHPF